MLSWSRRSIKLLLLHLVGVPYYFTEKINVYGIISTTEMRIEAVMTRCKKVHYSSHKINTQLVNRIKVCVCVRVCVCGCVCARTIRRALYKNSPLGHTFKAYFLLKSKTLNCYETCSKWEGNHACDFFAFAIVLEISSLCTCRESAVILFRSWTVITFYFINMNGKFLSQSFCFFFLWCKKKNVLKPCLCQ
jgi:hypothetical protein